jgi:hypothetical protein
MPVILAAQEATNRRILIQTRSRSAPEGKNLRLYLKNNLMADSVAEWMPSKREALSSTLRTTKKVQTQQKPLKSPKAKRDGGVAQVVECLPNSIRPQVQTPVPLEKKQTKTQNLKINLVCPL